LQQSGILKNNCFEVKKIMSSIEELKLKVQEKFKNWEETNYKKSTNKFPERLKEFTTQSFTKVDPLYYQNDLAENYNEKLGFPGEFPFTRGIQPTMYRGRFWTMRQGSEPLKNRTKDTVIY